MAITEDVPEWFTAVGEVAHQTIRVRGYALQDLIERCSFPQVAFLTIMGELPSAAQERTFNAALSSILEHGIYAPTTYAARIIASASPASIMPAVAGSMLTIGGVTASPQDTGEMVSAIIAAVAGGEQLEAAARAWVEESLQSGRRIPGIGHPLHPEGDPRSIALRRVAEAEGIAGAGCEAVDAVAAGVAELRGKRLPVNIDGMLGGVLTDLGFRPLQMAGVAALSFLPGIVAHAVEEIELSAGRPALRVVTDVHYVGPGPREIDGTAGAGE